MASIPRVVLVSVLIGTACGGTQSSREGPLRRSDRPFIKLANRRMALVRYLRGPTPTEAFVEQLERRLAKNLGATYRSEVPVVGRPVPFALLEPEVFLRLVEAGVDDIVVVELETQPDASVGARAFVYNPTDGRTRHQIAVPPVAGRRAAAPDPKVVADRISVALSHRWTDPGAAPKLDLLSAADELAAKGACPEAVALYDRVLDPPRPTSLFRRERRMASERRWKKCRRRIAVRDALAADRKAVFEVRLSLDRVSKQIAAAFRDAAAKPALKASLRALTNKPVVFEALPGALIMNLRFDPMRYRKEVSNRTFENEELPEIYLDPYTAAFDALLALKEDAENVVAAPDRPLVRSMQTALRLTKPPDDYLELLFGEEGGRLLFDRSVRIKVGMRDEVEIPSLDDRVSRRQRLLLGAPRDASGKLTAYGLIYTFFELAEDDQP